MANLLAKLSHWLAITSKILLLILNSRVCYNFSCRANDVNKVIFDAPSNRSQELVVPHLKNAKHLH